MVPKCIPNLGIIYLKLYLHFLNILMFK